MSIYLYRCQDIECSYEFEIFRSIKDDFLIDCPSCHQQTLSVIPFAVSVITKNEPKTIGSLAEQNTNKLGKYGREDLWARTEENKKLAKKVAREELSKKLPA